MPSHQDRVRQFNSCPYCFNPLMDGKHTFAEFQFAKVIGCPYHPNNNTILLINSEPESKSQAVDKSEHPYPNQIEEQDPESV